MGSAPPERFGRYQLVRRLAKGGMAEVWLARDDDAPERDLVIKRIHPHLATDPTFVLMFLDEARIAARIDHPGCVQIFDLGRVGDSYYIAMEYIHGEDIRSIARQARKMNVPLPRKLAVEIIAGACEGLHYAHDIKDAGGRPLNVVHRDVSPQNILVTYDGRVKIVDFGIAKAADQATRTRAGVLKGKYAYMSPEQVMGLPLDRRSDVFALGVLLYELTTGKRLFKADTELETMRRITKGGITRPTEASPGYPADLEVIVMRALAMKRENRTESADTLQDELREFLAAHKSSVSPEDLAAFMAKLFGERLAAEEAARETGDQEAFLAARFGEESSGSNSASSSADGAEVAQPAPEDEGDTQAGEGPAGLLDQRGAEAPASGAASASTDPTGGGDAPRPGFAAVGTAGLGAVVLGAPSPTGLKRWLPWIAVTVAVIGVGILALLAWQPSHGSEPAPAPKAPAHAARHAKRHVPRHRTRHGAKHARRH